MASTLTVDKIKGGSSGVALTLPTTDGSAGQLLKTDGSAVLSWATDVDTGITSVAADTTPQLGGDLDCNGAQIQWSKGADVVSATALPVLTDGNYFDVTGTTAVTSINTTGGAGTLIKLHFDAILTLTHHATDLILPGGANITTAAGDEAEFIEYAAGDYRCTNYSKADGMSVVGGLYDNSVTLAKMAHGTDGELITYDATGAPANVAVGTSGQVLTSGGAGVAPTFQTAAGVDTTGTPANNHIAVFTDSNTVEGDADLKWTGTDFWVGKGSGGGWANDGVELHNYGAIFLTRTPAHSSYGIFVIRRNTNAGRYQEFYKDSTLVGTIHGTTSSISYNTSSDYRLKENVVPMSGSIDRLKQLNPSRFNFIADADKTVDGFLAHEAQEVVPECATGTKDEVDDNGDAIMQGIDQAKLVPLLTAALQEAITKIEELTTRIEVLEGIN